MSTEQVCATLHSPAQVFLKYLYTGKIQVDYANVIPILQLADKYNVKDLLRWPSFIVFIKNVDQNASFHRVGLDFMSRNVALAARKNQVILQFRLIFNIYHDCSGGLLVSVHHQLRLHRPCPSLPRFHQVSITQSPKGYLDIKPMLLQVELHSCVLLDRLAAP